MKKHLLVTISNEAYNLYGVQFICSFFKKLSEHKLTLLHICRQGSSAMDKALNEMWISPDEKLQGQLTVGAKRALDKTSLMLAQSKMSIDSIKTKTVGEQYGKVKDILMEGAKGYYDAVVLGRRASYSMQWLFERPADEIAQTMIKDNCCTSPLWICPETDSSRKNVLVAVDGSDNGYRAVDHVGYILSRQDQHNITLFHAETGSSGTTSEIFKHARWVLKEHNISEKRINQRTTWSLTIPGTILSEVEKGGYAAVAVGLHGHKHGLLKDYKLAGGTTSKLVAKIEKSALWCCP